MKRIGSRMSSLLRIAVVSMTGAIALVAAILLFAAPCVFGAVGQAIGLFLMRGTPEAAFVDGRLPAFILPAPIDYAAAGLMGVSVGLGWARSFLHQEEDAPAASPSQGRSLSSAQVPSRSISSRAHWRI